MEFKGQLGQYKIIETEDNTQTVWSEFFNEACHNLSGAYTETLHNYIQGCDLSEQLQTEGHFHVLDVGFGVGIGLKAVLDLLQSSPARLPCTYTSIELDEDFFLWSLAHTLPDLKLERSMSDQIITYKGESIGLIIHIHIGDGRLTLPQKQSTIAPLTAIFQDAFSPKKNPALWSVEWFRFLKTISSTNVTLATYSSSISIRKSLLSAGWSVISARGFGNKRTMTKANFKIETDPQLLEDLNKSPILEILDN